MSGGHLGERAYGRPSLTLGWLGAGSLFAAAARLRLLSPLTGNVSTGREVTSASRCCLVAVLPASSVEKV